MRISALLTLQKFRNYIIYIFVIFLCVSGVINISSAVFKISSHSFLAKSSYIATVLQPAAFAERIEYSASSYTIASSGLKPREAATFIKVSGTVLSVSKS